MENEFYGFSGNFRKKVKKKMENGKRVEFTENGRRKVENGKSGFYSLFSDI